MTLGARIEERRLLLGISQAELARRVGVRQSTMNSLINGDSRTSRSLLKIARELQTSAAYLTGETDDPDTDVPEVDPIDSETREILDCIVRFAPADRRALLQLARTIAGAGVTPTVHSPKTAFRGRGE